MDRKVKYVINSIIVLCVYTVLFEQSRLDVNHSIVEMGDMGELLCAISGLSVQLMIELKMTRWMLGLSVIFALVGREVYNQLCNLKYIAMIRYGSYRKFYRSLMTRTVVSTLLYGSCGTGITYVLYAYEGKGQVSNREFLEISVIYVSQLLLLCLLQTLCMILTQGYAASVLLLVSWFIMAMCGHMVPLLNVIWIWLPANWGMYVRGAKMVEGGVPDMAYYIQIGICVLLWIGVPFVVKRKQ